MNASRRLLRDRILQSAVMLRGAPEHAHFAKLVRQAAAYRLSQSTTGALAQILDEQTATIERNLDLLRIPSSGMWIEFDEADRRQPSDSAKPLFGGRHPISVGVLLCNDSSEPDRIVLMTAWDFEDDSVRHSYAVAAFSRTDIANRAFLARTRWGSGQIESLARMVSLAHAYFPPGLKAEMEVIAKEERATKRDIAAAEETSRRDVVSEAPFAFASALLITAVQFAEASPYPDIRDITLPTQKRSLLEKAGLGTLVKRGFIRHGDQQQPSLGFTPLT